MAKVPLISEEFRQSLEDGSLINPCDGSDPSTWKRWVPQTPEEWDEEVEIMVDLWNNRIYTLREVLRLADMEWHTISRFADEDDYRV